MEEGKASKMRIYVGGLGEAMTEDDLRRIFHSVGGEVETIDILQTKSRNFAYVDFSPSSQNSLPKLFSTYNGCAWKGGKLRLEKAKEHYLVRLKGEWEEDAQFENSSDDVNLELSASESVQEAPKSDEIQIFFPSLGKVKSLPISGRGTHLYSFPHVEVPALPVHFCDCEEHVVSAPPIGNSKGTKTGGFEARNGGMGEGEIQLMNAVMNKLFERQNTSEPNYNGTKAVKDDEDDAMTLTDSLQQSEDDKVDSDEDNLVLNVISGGSNTKTMTFNNENEIIFKAPRSSKGVSMNQKLNSRLQNKKRKSIMSEEIDRNNYVSGIPSGNESTHLVHESAIPSKPQPVDPAMQNHSSCLQKPSWKALISDTSTVAFSISHVLPSVPSVSSAAEGQSEADGLDPAHSTPNRNRNTAIEAVLGSESEDTKSMKSPAESQQTISNVTLNKGRGSSWLQKYSWTQLVSEENNTSFSITQILPSNTSGKNTQMDLSAANVNNSSGSRNDDSVKEDEHRIAEDGSVAFLVRKENTFGKDVKKDEQLDVPRSEHSTSQVIESHIPQQTHSNDVKSGESCPFMRNSRSLAKWAKIKAALSGSSKKKKQRS